MWPYKDPLGEASYEDSFQVHLMDVHRLSTSHPHKAAHSTRRQRPPNENGPLSEGTEEASLAESEGHPAFLETSSGCHLSHSTGLSQNLPRNDSRTHPDRG